MVKRFVDREYGGIYWAVSAKGKPVNDMKHGYCNAFFIYALSGYYKASGDLSALKLAVEMFDIIEERLSDYDNIGYRESCDRSWSDLPNDELSENGIKAVKTMNTVLHLIEAYTELYRVLPIEFSDKRNSVSGRLEYLLELAYGRLYDKSRRRLSVFFDEKMDAIGDVHSYGHDIESAWLTGRAIDVAGDVLPAGLKSKIRGMNRVLVAEIDEVAFDKSGAMYYENDNGTVNKNRVWWAQAEALVGFVDAYGLYGDEKYLHRAEKLWEYIKNHMIDRREAEQGRNNGEIHFPRFSPDVCQNGEWYNELDENNVPVTAVWDREKGIMTELPIVSEWKCPYHNGRMCMEIIERLGGHTDN
jgi:mannobiose 2-epimerase